MIKNELIPLVNLYRLFDRPSVTGFKFEVNVILTQEHIDLLEEFYQLKDKNGSQIEVDSEYFSVNNFESFVEKKSEMVGSKAKIYTILRRNNKKRFYLSSKELYDPAFSNTISSELDLYYLIQEDYFHGVDDISNRPQSMAVFEEILFFIDKIKSLSDSFDTRNKVSKATLFLPDSDDKDRVRPFDIYLEINDSLIDLAPESFTILKDIELKDFEKSMLLKNALCEVFLSVQNSNNHIAFFFENWSKVEEAYHNNYDVYIRGISFSKLRQEVEERHLKYYDDVSSSLIDISLKISILPTTFSVWLFFVRSDSSSLKNFGFLMALLAMACLFSYVLSSQKNKLIYLKRGLKKQANIFLRQYRDSKKDYEIESTIEAEIQAMETDVKTKIEKAYCWVLFGYCVIWLPVIVVLIAWIYSLIYPAKGLFSCGLLLTS